MDGLRSLRRGECTQALDFFLVALGRPRATHRLEAAEHQPGVGDIGLAIRPDVGDAPLLPGGPDLRAIHALLAGKATQFRQRIQRCIRARGVQRQHIHQIEMARVIAVQVIVVAELAVTLALLPVAFRMDPVDQRPVVQHLQIETATVPGDELRRVLLDQMIEGLHECAFVILQTTKGVEGKLSVSGTQQHRDRSDPMQIQRQEIRSGLFPAPGKRLFRDSGIIERFVACLQRTQTDDIRNRLDIEAKEGRHAGKPGLRLQP